MASKKARKLPYVLVRTYSAGVHAGELVSRKGKEVTLRNARRVWYWTGAASLSELAVHGSKTPATCKICVPVSSIDLTEAIEVITPTATGEKFLREAAEWRA